MQSIFEAMGGTYVQSGDYLIPNIALPAAAPLGRWGRQRRKYLQENQEAYFLALLLTDKLYEHLTEVDQRAEEMYDRLTEQMVAARGITEQLKAEDPMRWVGEMNNIRAAAEEIILSEVIYA